MVCNVGKLNIGGIVIDRNGTPIKTAHIRCSGNHRFDTQTDGDGRFIVEDLSPGFYTIAAEHIAHLGVVLEDVAAGTVNLRLEMPDAVTVYGRVIDASSGNPLTNYEVKCCYGPEYMRLDQGYATPEGDDDTFRLSSAKRGEVRIAARAKGYLLSFADILVGEGSEPIYGVQILLKPQADLAGSVHDEAGNPVVGALIFTGIPERPLHEDFASTQTKRDGRFDLAAQRLGHEAITVTHPEFPSLTVDVTPAHFAGQPIEIQLLAGATLECTVLENSAPAKAYVSAIPAGYDGRSPQFIHAQTREDGMCTLRGIAPGECRVQATLPSEVQMVTGAMIETVLMLERGTAEAIDFPFITGDGVLSGTIIGSAESLRLDLTVSVGNGVQRYHAFLDGVVEPGTVVGIPRLPGGPATVRVSWSADDGGHEIEHDLVLAKDATTEITLDLEAMIVAETSEFNYDDQASLTTIGE